MKLKVNYFVFLVFIFSTSFCFSQGEARSPYHVGFKYYKTYDESRSYVLNNDTISRPLLIHFWYPSNENIEKGSYSFKHYIDLISLREDFNKASSEVDGNSLNFINAYAGYAKQNLGLDTSITTQKILDCSVVAKYGVELAKSRKKFPLIIYAPSNSKSSIQNHMICEYLSSHGFMVVSVGSAGSESINRNHDQKSILAQVVDMEYILNYFEDSLKIKYAGLGLMGFSSGGLATAIFQMRNKKVKAVFSMDGSQEYGSYITLFNTEDFNLSKTNVPYCLLTNNYGNFSIYPFYNSIVSGDKYMFRMPYLDHNGFVSYWRFLDTNQEVFKSKENEIIILSKLFKDPNVNASIQLLLFNNKMHPESWQTLLELSSAYKMNGDLSIAKETVLKAQQLNPENGGIISLLNEINKL